MRTYTTPDIASSYHYQPPVSRHCRLSWPSLEGVGLFFILVFGSLAGFDMTHKDKIYPGVSVGGIDVSGLHPAEAAALLAQRFDYPSRGRIAFQEGGSVWVVRPGELGLFFDAQSSAMQAFNYGRQGDPFSRVGEQISAWKGGATCRR